MERAWLAQRLGAGRSIESIAREAACSASKVAYWARRHGLESAHAARHASRGGIERATLATLVDRGLTIREMATELGVGSASVRHWLARHGLRTARARWVAEPADGEAAVEVRRCRHHGLTDFVRAGDSGRYRCKRCRVDAVNRRRRAVKRTLVDEAGGACALCGYDRFLGALQFHHLDPAEKSFSISRQGEARSLAKARTEARKCIVLCANCHAEVEAGIATIPGEATSLG